MNARRMVCSRATRGWATPTRTRRRRRHSLDIDDAILSRDPQTGNGSTTTEMRVQMPSNNNAAETRPNPLQPPENYSSPSPKYGTNGNTDSPVPSGGITDWLAASKYPIEHANIQRHGQAHVQKDTMPLVAIHTHK